MSTVSYVTKAQDSRCRFWEKHLTREQLQTIDLAGIDGADSVPGSYVRRGSDHEIDHDIVIIQGEENHHRKQRGWTYRFGIADADGIEIKWEVSAVSRDKSEMKSAGFQIVGSGPVAGVLRLAQFRCR